MSASYVQKAQAHGSGVTSITTVGMNTTTGNTVVVSIGSGPDFTSLTDNGTSNTVTAVGVALYNPGGGELDLTVKCLQNINGKTGHTFTANFSGSDFVSMTASEITGVTASPLDTGSVATAHPLTSPYTVTSGTFAQADELVMLFNEPYCGGTSTFSESTGFTSIGGENDNNNYCGNWNWYKNISATTALTPSVTDSTGTGYTAMLMVIAGFKSAGAVAVNPGVGSVTLTGYAPTIAQPHAVLPGAGSISISGFSPSVVQNTNVNPGVGSLTLTGYAPSISQPQTAAPGAGTITLTGYAPSISQGQSAFPAAGSLAITGYAPSISQPQTAAPGVGSLAITGYAPIVAQPQTAAPGVGALSLTGLAPTIAQSANQALIAGAGTVSFTGYAPSIAQTANQALTAGAGVLAFTGYAPTVTQAAGSPSLTPSAGVLSITGYAPNVVQASPLTRGLGGDDGWKKKKRIPLGLQELPEPITYADIEAATKAKPKSVVVDEDEEEILMLLL